jgi:nucleotide-binding universal stress UspA family protein
VATNGAYTRIVVPVREGPASERAVRVACGLAAERGASIAALAVVEVPPLLPLGAHMVEEEQDARKALQEAQAIADSYGVALMGQIVRAREAAGAILEQADVSHAEVIVLGAERHVNGTKRSPVFGRTARAVLNESSCPVVLVGGALNGRVQG